MNNFTKQEYYSKCININLHSKWETRMFKLENKIVIPN